MSNSKTATVEVLTAEVRVLSVGSRQVTMSVYNQLDTVPCDSIQAYGRVSPPRGDDGAVYVVGRAGDGTLARAEARRIRNTCSSYVHATDSRCDEHRGLYGVPDNRWETHRWFTWEPYEELWHSWQALPLIVLAGLR